MTSIIGGFRPAVKGAGGQQADPVRSHVRLMNALSGALSKCSCELGVISLAPGTRVAPSAHFGSEILSPSPVPKPGLSLAPNTGWRTGVFRELPGSDLVRTCLGSHRDIGESLASACGPGF